MSYYVLCVYVGIKSIESELRTAPPQKNIFFSYNESDLIWHGDLCCLGKVSMFYFKNTI